MRRRARAGEEFQDIRDAVCLDAYNQLIAVKALALIIGISRVTVWRWIRRARENPRPPDLEIWMSGAGKACAHRRPIVPGMPVICLDCLERDSPSPTGLPDHPAFRREKACEASEKPKAPPKSKLQAEAQGKVVYATAQSAGIGRDSTRSSRKSKHAKTGSAGGSGESS